jgi:hypothetical protein
VLEGRAAVAAVLARVGRRRAQAAVARIPAEQHRPLDRNRDAAQVGVLGRRRVGRGAGKHDQIPAAAAATAAISRTPAMPVEMISGLPG